MKNLCFFVAIIVNLAIAGNVGAWQDNSYEHYNAWEREEKHQSPIYIPDQDKWIVPSGNGGMIDPQSGTYYAPAGPSGYVNTRNGQFIPGN